MASHVPPVPPANRSPKGTGESAQAEPDNAKLPKAVNDPGKQGQQGNSGVNTHNQGYQQDR